MKARIDIPNKGVSEFCHRWKVTELALFGSVLSEDFGPDSDVDVLVRFAPKSRRTLFDMVRMKTELAGLFGRDIDLVSRRAIEKSRNYLRKKAILQSAEVVYGS